MLLDAGDEAGALAIVEGAPPAHPLRTPRARYRRGVRAAADRGEARRRKLGSLTRVPKLAVSLDQLVSLSLDHRAGFLISFVDGASTLATILDMSGMSPSEVLRTFVELNERGIIKLR